MEFVNWIIAGIFPDWTIGVATILWAIPRGKFMKHFAAMKSP
jgi:hypothetical protein